MAKRTKTSKLPDYRSMVPPGTIIGFPLGDRRLAFGRILSVTADGVAIIEVFRKTGQPGDFDDEVLRSGFLVPPFVQTLTPIIDLDWPIIHTDKDFVLSAPESELEFVIGGWPLWHKTNIQEEIIARCIPATEAAALLPTEMIRSEERLQRIREAVENRRSWAPGEPDPKWAAYVLKSMD